MTKVSKAAEVIKLLEPFLEYIKKVKGEWCVFSHQTDKNFGCYKSEKEATERLQQIKAFSSN